VGDGPPTEHRGAPWDPAGYLEFADHRLRPAFDLIGRIDLDPRTVWDLGCGTGHVTALLARRWPGARVHGLDRSADMLDEARRIDGIEWVHGDVTSWEPAEPADLLFSNAALHWVDDHAAVFPRLVSFLAEGGILAVQMPRNFAEPSHTLLAEKARSPRWKARLGDVARTAPVAEPAAYYDVLAPLVDGVDIWETEYLHVLDGPDPVARWAGSTAARPYLGALAADADAFMADYAEALREAYPRRPDGTTLFPFRRLFIVATK
jgi:trans-aconitate 2-methyltransferase